PARARAARGDGQRARRAPRRPDRRRPDADRRRRRPGARQPHRATGHRRPAGRRRAPGRQPGLDPGHHRRARHAAADAEPRAVASMAKRFGTDGIRGEVGSEITVALSLALGRAVGHRYGGGGRTVVLGRDTRRSGEMLSAALTAGLTATGTDVVDLGVVTTPCLVHASTSEAFAAGIMVSASHNPAPDNGLKVVVDGRKANGGAEAELDALITDPSPIPHRPNEELGRIRADRGAV